MQREGRIRLATCQFPVNAGIRRNAAYIVKQIAEAKRRRADLVHFSECALSGYAGSEYDSWDAFDWETLHAETRAISDLARRRKLWVVLGSAHRLTGAHLPHNALYVIDPRGRIVDRYDKRFCTGSDLRFYSPGDHLPTFTVNGVKCGALICHDFRYPELYRAYWKLGVACILNSFHNTRRESGRNLHTMIVRPTVQARAASNDMWISANNSSARYQSWTSFLARPDGEVVAALRRHRAGVMVNTVDTRTANRKKWFRDNAVRGVLHSGRLVNDPRSRNRTSL